MPAGKKDRARELVAAKLATGSTVADAALAGGISDRTVFAWLATPRFKKRVDDLQSQAVSQAVGKLADGLAEAADVLRELLKSDSDAIRLRAADAMFRNAIAIRETHELAKQVEEIAGRLAAAGVK